MTEILSGFYSTIMEHPLLTLLIFVAATSVIFYLFSEDEPGESLAGVFAVIRSYVSTPFDVLRKAPFCPSPAFSVASSPRGSQCASPEPMLENRASFWLRDSAERERVREREKAPYPVPNTTALTPA